MITLIVIWLLAVLAFGLVIAVSESVEDFFTMTPLDREVAENMRRIKTAKKLK